VERDCQLARELNLDGRFVILYAGNMGRPQGLDTLIQAAGLLRDLVNLRIVLVGDGVERAHLQAMASELNVRNVLFVDRQPPERIPYFCALADFLFVGLVNDPYAAKAVPSKIPSYMACGRPILSAVPGDAATLLNDTGCGITCQPGDPKSLADAIRKVYFTGDEERNAMGARAREVFVKRFRKDLLVSQHEHLLKYVADLNDDDGSPFLAAKEE
jgi:glycosyltransferase involved in cell wall biosynthesis